MSPDKQHRKQGRRYERKRRQVLKDLQQRVRENFSGQEVRFGAPSDGRKMSEVLEAFVEPYMDDVETREQYEVLLTLGMAAWNAALIPQEKDMVDPILAAMPRDLRRDGRRLLTELLHRKRTKFAGNKRGIISFSVTDMPDGTWHLAVVSSQGPLSTERSTLAPRGFWTWLRSLWPWR